MDNDHTVSLYDRVRGGLDGAAVFTKPSTVKHTEVLTGKSETYIVETARHHELGDTIFVECMNADGLVRIALPPKVANAIARQRNALTDQIRSREARRVAKERKEAGHIPFTKKAG